MARSSNKINIRNKFYIITNGAQTEKNYFDLLKSKHSIYSVKVIFYNADPLKLVQFATRYNEDANQIWCVFDVDYSYEDKQLIQALQFADKNNIKIAYSNRAFEVWLISHFQQCERELFVPDYKRILDKYVQNINSNCEYTKDDRALLQKYFVPNYKIAVQNAKIVYQKHVRELETDYNGILPVWEWNSSTSVFKLVEALKLRL